MAPKLTRIYARQVVKLRKLAKKYPLHTMIKAADHILREIKIPPRHFSNGIPIDEKSYFFNFDDPFAGSIGGITEKNND